MKSNDINIVELEQKIKHLRLSGKYEEALELCNVDNINIKFLRVKTLIILGQYNKNIKYLKEALEICHFYSADKRFKNKILYIQNIIHEYNPIMEKLLSKIYFNNIDLREIEDAYIDEWTKDILTVAYYDRKKDKKRLELIKSLKIKYKDEAAKTKILNILYSKLISKKHYFDLTDYEKIIGCFIDFNINNNLELKDEQLEDKPKISKPVTISSIKNNKKVKTKVTPKIISCTGVKNNSRYNNQNNLNSTNSNVISNQSLLIKDLFPLETEAIYKNLYAMMSYIEYRMMAVEAWDKFEVLINKSACDKDALKRMINLLERIQNRNQTVNPNYDHVKYQKLLSKN